MRSIRICSVLLLLMFDCTASNGVFAHPLPGGTFDPAPLLRLTSADGRKISSGAFQSQIVPVAFLCGCDRCHAFASQWARQQRQRSAGTARLIIVFSGDATAAKSFAAETMLDSAKTLILCDPNMVAKAKYDVDTCPCVFVVDKDDDILYRKQAPDIYSPRLPVGFLRRLMDALSKGQPKRDKVSAE